jgi:hypothetical protein
MRSGKGDDVKKYSELLARLAELQAKFEISELTSAEEEEFDETESQIIRYWISQHENFGLAVKGLVAIEDDYPDPR